MDLDAIKRQGAEGWHQSFLSAWTPDWRQVRAAWLRGFIEASQKRHETYCHFRIFASLRKVQLETMPNCMEMAYHWDPRWYTYLPEAPVAEARCLRLRKDREARAFKEV